MASVNWRKQPNEVRDDYFFDFSEWLASVGESALLSMTVSVVPSTGLVLKSSSLENRATVVRMRFSDGVNGVAYKVSCVGTTTDGRKKEQEQWLVVRDE